ncbi:dethiobiotin synthase [Acetivibrio straminisolvens]|uniref:ATP-dependent dethiobiotin synthetase BioD n=1 Tax=Acetivibrio straminisolvens JCM 21531 TaxID=1294263 RepID=W4V6K4_9FIRM|nr:dethiobiotin synthase [Acetivibrio straminisolvens]GAE88827.1 dethiobiotin synthetase [Acetivibrio straminisolvens JCM 21531]
MSGAKGIYIIGTDTDVGKTVVCAGLMYLLKSKGYDPCYFKPVSSGGRDTENGFFSYDASFVKAVSGFDEDDNMINPFRFRIPVSPHLASEMEGFAVDKEIIRDRYNKLIEKYRYIVVEGCGGLAVPLTKDGYLQFQLVKEMGLGCILISRTTLGTINHTLLTVSFAQNAGIPIKGIVFSGFSGDDAERDNIETIRHLTKVPVIGVIPKIEGINVEDKALGELKSVFEKQ